MSLKSGPNKILLNRNIDMLNEENEPNNKLENELENTPVKKPEDEFESENSSRSEESLVDNTLKGFKNYKMFAMIVLMIASCGSTTAHLGLMGVSIPQMEKYIQIKSSTAGIISSMHDIGVCVCAIFIGFIHVNNPLSLIGVGYVVMIFGCALFILPNFLSFSNFQMPGVIPNGDLCQVGNMVNLIYNQNCRIIYHGWWNSNGKNILMFLGYFLIGTGCTFTVIFGPIIINNLPAPTKVSKVLGIFYLFSIMGPIVGYLFGIAANSMLNTALYTNIIVERFKQEIGTWWMGYIFGILFFILIIIMVLINVITCTRRQETGRGKYVANHDSVQEDEVKMLSGRPKKYNKKIKTTISKLKKFISHFCKGIKILSSNWIYLIISLTCILTQFLVFGYSIFLPKFIIYNYGLTGSMSTITAGLATIPAACLGVLFGAMIMNNLKSKTYHGSLFCSILMIISTCLSPAFLIYCRKENFIYSETSMSNSNIFDQYSPRCAKNCNCEKTDKFKACFEEEAVDFINPCLGGCSVLTNNGGVKKYTNCTCLNKNFHNISLTEGACRNTCGSMISWVFCMFIMNFCIFSTCVPVTQITLSLTKPKYQAISYSLQQLFQRGIGQCIGPIVIGNLIDKACSRWAYDRCLNRTNCMAYSMETYRYTLFIVGIIVLLCNSILFLLAGYLSKNKQLKGV